MNLAGQQISTNRAAWTLNYMAHLWLRKEFRIRLVGERKNIIGKRDFLIAYFKNK